MGWRTAATPTACGWRGAGTRTACSRCSPRCRTEAVPAETDDGAAATRFPLFDAVASVVALTSRDRPLLLVLDDLHWADRGSLRLLRFLAMTTEASPVIVLGAFREHDAEAADLDALRDRATVLAVPPLSVAEVHLLLETQHQLHATPADAQRVADRTGGNPLFVGEIGRLAAARGLDVVGDALPASAVATIARRVARLSQPAAEVLGTAAVAGPVVDVRLLTRVLPLTASDVQLLLDEAVQVGLVVVSGDQRLGFSHALVRDALEAGLPDPTRRELHLDIARALLAGGGPVPDAEVAHHFSAAGSLAPPGAAARHWSNAAEVAARAQAYEVAAGAFARALVGMPADDVERPRLLRRRGDCLLLSGDLAAARVAFAEACDLARAAGRPEDFAGAALGFAAGLSGFEVRLFDHAQIDLLEEALDAAARGRRRAARIPAGPALRRAVVPRLRRAPGRPGRGVGGDGPAARLAAGRRPRPRGALRRHRRSDVRGAASGRVGRDRRDRERPG